MPRHKPPEKTKTTTKTKKPQRPPLQKLADVKDISEINAGTTSVEKRNVVKDPAGCLSGPARALMPHGTAKPGSAPLAPVETSTAREARLLGGSSAVDAAVLGAHAAPGASLVMAAGAYTAPHQDATTGKKCPLFIEPLDAGSNRTLVLSNTHFSDVVAKTSDNGVFCVEVVTNVFKHLITILGFNPHSKTPAAAWNDLLKVGRALLAGSPADVKKGTVFKGTLAGVGAAPAGAALQAAPGLAAAADGAAAAVHDAAWNSPKRVDERQALYDHLVDNKIRKGAESLLGLCAPNAQSLLADLLTGAQHPIHRLTELRIDTAPFKDKFDLRGLGPYAYGTYDMRSDRMREVIERLKILAKSVRLPARSKSRDEDGGGDGEDDEEEDSSADEGDSDEDDSSSPEEEDSSVDDDDNNGAAAAASGGGAGNSSSAGRDEKDKKKGKKEPRVACHVTPVVKSRTISVQRTGIHRSSDPMEKRSWGVDNQGGCFGLHKVVLEATDYLLLPGVSYHGLKALLKIPGVLWLEVDACNAMFAVVETKTSKRFFTVALPIANDVRVGSSRLADGRGRSWHVLVGHLDDDAVKRLCIPGTLAAVDPGVREFMVMSRYVCDPRLVVQQAEAVKVKEGQAHSRAFSGWSAVTDHTEEYGPAGVDKAEEGGAAAAAAAAPEAGAASANGGTGMVDDGADVAPAAPAAEAKKPKPKPRGARGRGKGGGSGKGLGQVAAEAARKQAPSRRQVAAAGAAAQGPAAAAHGLEALVLQAQEEAASSKRGKRGARRTMLKLSSGRNVWLPTKGKRAKFNLREGVVVTLVVTAGGYAIRFRTRKMARLEGDFDTLFRQPRGNDGCGVPELPLCTRHSIMHAMGMRSDTKGTWHVVRTDSSANLRFLYTLTGSFIPRGYEGRLPSDDASSEGGSEDDAVEEGDADGAQPPPALVNICPTLPYWREEQMPSEAEVAAMSARAAHPADQVARGAEDPFFQLFARFNALAVEEEGGLLQERYILDARTKREYEASATVPWYEGVPISKKESLRQALANVSGLLPGAWWRNADGSRYVFKTHDVEEAGFPLVADGSGGVRRGHGGEVAGHVFSKADVEASKKRLQTVESKQAAEAARAEALALRPALTLAERWVGGGWPSDGGGAASAAATAAASDAAPLAGSGGGAGGRRGGRASSSAGGRGAAAASAPKAAPLAGSGGGAGGRGGGGGGRAAASPSVRLAGSGGSGTGGSAASSRSRRESAGAGLAAALKAVRSGGFEPADAQPSKKAGVKRRPDAAPSTYAPPAKKRRSQASAAASSSSSSSSPESLDSMLKAVMELFLKIANPKGDLVKTINEAMRQLKKYWEAAGGVAAASDGAAPFDAAAQPPPPPPAAAADPVRQHLERQATRSSAAMDALAAQLEGISSSGDGGGGAPAASGGGAGDAAEPVADPHHFLTAFGGGLSKKFDAIFDKIFGYQHRLGLLRRGSRAYKKLHRRMLVLYRDLRDLVYNLHRRTAWVMTTNSIVYVPWFPVKQMVGRGSVLLPETKRDMLTLGHYAFKVLLLTMAARTGTKVIFVDEAYTSKTCPNCLTINDKLGGSKKFWCDSPTCTYEADRDNNGSHGVFIKSAGNWEMFIPPAQLQQARTDVRLRATYPVARLQALAVLRVLLAAPTALADAAAAEKAARAAAAVGVSADDAAKKAAKADEKAAAAGAAAAAARATAASCRRYHGGPGGARARG